MKKCKKCGREMEEKLYLNWHEGSVLVIIKTLQIFQCPKCKEIETVLR